MTENFTKKLFNQSIGANIQLIQFNYCLINVTKLWINLSNNFNGFHNTIHIIVFYLSFQSVSLQMIYSIFILSPDSTHYNLFTNCSDLSDTRKDA